MESEHFHGRIDRFDNFLILADILHRQFRSAPRIHTERWQSVDISQMSHMAMREMLHYSFALELPGENLQFYRDTIKPNLPWADDHFTKDRVSGEPLNPGNTYQDWTPGQAASGNHSTDHLRKVGMNPQFDHSYAERYWPRFAGKTADGMGGRFTPVDLDMKPNRGVRFEYGDLNTLVDLLSGQPLTRQAYLPVWFPEDLYAAMEPRRVPCTLGYHFIMRNGQLDVTYYIRSCDYNRHFRDDVYLTIRLLLWILQQCRLAAPEKDWHLVQPGRLLMHITSFHMFEADHKRIYREPKSAVVQHLEDGGGK